MNKDIYLTETGSIVKRDSGPQIATGRENTRHRLRIRLLWARGEWELLPNTGIPYIRSMREKPPLLDNLRSAIQKEIIEDDEVKRIEAIRFDINEETREMDIEVDVKLTDDASITVTGGFEV